MVLLHRLTISLMRFCAIPSAMEESGVDARGVVRAWSRWDTSRHADTEQRNDVTRKDGEAVRHKGGLQSHSHQLHVATNDSRSQEPSALLRRGEQPAEDDEKRRRRGRHVAVSRLEGRARVTRKIINK